MAIENAKLLNVRIKNKYDSYENWASSGLVLEPGEIAIAHTTVDVAVNNGTAKHPALLMKVGDGEKTFANLPWLSAKAADVLSVCKNETELTAFVNSVIADAGIASDEAMEALAGRVTTAEGAIGALEALVGTDKVADQIQNAIAALNLDTTYEKVGVAKGLVDALADGAVKDNADAIAAINHEETGVLAQAKAHADGLDSAMDARVDIVEAKLSDIDEKYTVGQVIDFEIKNVEARINQLGRTLGQDIVKINSKLKGFSDSDYAVYNAVSAAKEAGENAQADVDALELVVAKQADVDAALVLKADQTALQAEIDRAKAAEEANAAAIKLLQGVDAETLADVENLVKYVEDHGPEVVQIQKDIKANADAIDALEAIDHEAYKAADTALKSDLEEQIALKANASAVTDLETALDARLVVLEAIDHDAYIDADAALKDELIPLINAKAAQTDLEALELLVGEEKVADQIDAKIEALNLANAYEAKGTAETLNTAMNARVEVLEAIDHTKFEAAGAAAQALADAKTYADGKDTVMNARVEALEAKDVVLYSDTIVFDCGTSAI